MMTYKGERSLISDIKHMQDEISGEPCALIVTSTVLKGANGTLARETRGLPYLQNTLSSEP